MTATKDANLQVFDKAMGAFEKKLALVVNNKLVSLAERYVERAVEDWQQCKPAMKKDMTGNLITGFASGVYMNGKLIHIAGATEGGINGVSGQAEYWMVGRNELTAWEDRGLYEEQGGTMMFRDFDTGAEVYDVFDYNPESSYKWQDVPERRYAIDLAVSFLHSYQDNLPKHGYYIVVCNGATYADYLRSVRRLDVMTSLQNELRSGEFKREMKKTINSIQL